MGNEGNPGRKGFRQRRAERRILADARLVSDIDDEVVERGHVPAHLTSDQLRKARKEVVRDDIGAEEEVGVVVGGLWRMYTNLRIKRHEARQAKQRK